MLVPAFYSPYRGMALEDVWHNNSECTIGQSIPVADRWPVPDHIRKRCPYCALLDKPAPKATH